MFILTEIINEMFNNELLDEKIIKVKHLKAKQKALARKYRMKNKNKLKRRLKRYKMKIKNKPKRKGYSYGVDGKLHKITMRRGIRFKKHR